MADRRTRRITFVCPAPLALALSTHARFTGRSQADVMRSSIGYYLRRESKRKRVSD